MSLSHDGKVAQLHRQIDILQTLETDGGWVHLGLDRSTGPTAGRLVRSGNVERRWDKSINRYCHRITAVGLQWLLDARLWLDRTQCIQEAEADRRRYDHVLQ